MKRKMLKFFLIDTTTILCFPGMVSGIRNLHGMEGIVWFVIPGFQP